MLNEEKIIELARGGHDSDWPATWVQAIRTGLPLESGLRALAEQTRSRRTREALLQLGENLERGMSLADALEVSNAELPRSMRALVQAGLETGRLDSVMQYCVEQSQRAISLRQQIWVSLSYPMFLVWFAMVICGGVLLRIAHPFRQILDDFGTELPDLTVVLMTVSSTMNGAWLVRLWVVIAIASGPMIVSDHLAFGMTRIGVDAGRPRFHGSVGSFDSQRCRTSADFFRCWWNRDWVCRKHCDLRRTPATITG